MSAHTTERDKTLLRLRILSSTLRRWSLARRAVVPTTVCGLLAFSVLGLRLWNSTAYCCVTLATTL